MKRNEGFTLVELLVTLSAAALVTIAAASLLLLGTRIQYASSGDVTEQQTVRVVMSLLENMASSGDISEIVSTYDGWQMKNPEKVLFEYVATEQTVYQGERGTGVPLLTGLNNAGVTMDDDNKMMRLSFETERGGSYTAKVYCRTGVTDKNEVDVNVSEIIEQNAPKLDENDLGHRRLAFLAALANEYIGGKNTGEIQDPITHDDVKESYDYYSQWYIGDGWGSNGWNKDTPWCACFVSWAGVRSGVVPRDDDQKDFVFANVDEGMRLFKDNTLEGEWVEANDDLWAGDNKGPTPGDYVFFDWSGKKKDPAHVGVVLDVRAGYIYTIEGNSSNRVAVRCYAWNEEDIMGYGILPQFLPETVDS